MLAKLTSKNQLTLPKSVTDQLGAVQYFEVSLHAGQVVLTPVRIQRGDAVRAKLAELSLDDQAIDQALAWTPAASVKAPAKKTTRAVAKKVPKAAKTTAAGETKAAPTPRRRSA